MDVRRLAERFGAPAGGVTLAAPRAAITEPASPPDAVDDGVDVRGLDAHERSPAEERKVGQQSEQGACGHHGGEHADQHAEDQGKGEALGLSRGELEDHRGGKERQDVRIEDRAKATRVTGIDRRAHGAAAAHLFFDPFEDDDVGVGRHADGEDHAGDAGQRERDGNGVEQPPQQHGVDDERDVGHKAQEPVVEEHVEQDQPQAGQAGDQGLVQ